MYVKKDNLIYRICDSVVFNPKKFCTYYNLELICGYDYINSSPNKKECYLLINFQKNYKKMLLLFL